MNIGPQHGFKAHWDHLVAHIKAHVHLRNILKTKMLVAGLAGLKMMVAHSIVWVWLAAKGLVVKKLFLVGLFGVVAMIEGVLGLTPTGQTQASCFPTNGGIEICDAIDNDCDNLTDEGYLISCLQCSPYYEQFDYNSDGFLDNEDTTILQNIILNSGNNGQTCQQLYPTKDCDPNDSGTTTAADVLYLQQIINGAHNEGEVCDGLDNNCNGTVDEANQLTPPVDSAVGVCSTVDPVCTGTGGWVVPDYLGVTGYQLVELDCNDNLDNDCDGLTDCNGMGDSSCNCDNNLSGTIWNDLDEDGIRDAGEPNYTGDVTITIQVFSGAILGDAMVQNGIYWFNGLVQGTTYVITYTRNDPSYSISPQDQGNNNNIDSDISPNTAQVIVAYQGNLIDMDMGLFQSTDPTAGICGSADLNSPLDHEPTLSELCVNGTPSNVQVTPTTGGQGATWTWICEGLNGGADSSQCTATTNACGMAPFDQAIICNDNIPAVDGQPYHVVTGSSCGSDACTYCSDPDANGICGTQHGWDPVCTTGQTQSCGTDVGACSVGTQACVGSGIWGSCTGAVDPVTEVCSDAVDNDCDGSIDEGCSSGTGGGTGGGSSGGGSSGGGTNGGNYGGGFNFCGDGKVKSTEECDDGNIENGDGCTSNCFLEGTPGHPRPDKPPHGQNPADRLSDMISRSLDKMYSLCKYSDRDYNRITFKDYDMSRHGDEIQMLKDMCIVSGRPNHRLESIRMMRSGETYFEPQAPALIGEFLKVLVKLVALNDGIQFYEDKAYELRNQKTSYTDISKYAWYRPYVIYGERKGLLDNIRFGIVDSELKPLTRITQDVADQMLRNANVDKDYFDLMGNDGYVSRMAMAKIMVDAFPEKFTEYEHLFGNNVMFYEGLIKILERKSAADQRAYVQHLITQLEKLDAKRILHTYGLDIDGIIKYLKKLLTY